MTAASVGHKRSFFEVYKPGQGRYTRLGTALGGGILTAGAGHFLYKNLEAVRSDEVWTLLVQLLVPVILVVGWRLLRNRYHIVRRILLAGAAILLIGGAS